MVKMLTVLVSAISKSEVFLLKNVSSFCNCKSYSHFVSKNSSIFAIFNDQSFNDTLTNDIISFEQLGLVVLNVASASLVCVSNGSETHCKWSIKRTGLRKNRTRLAPVSSDCFLYL